MANITIGTVNLYKENNDVYISSNEMAIFLCVDHKNIMKEVEKYKNNKDVNGLFEECVYLDAINYKRHVIWYNIEREGCFLLLKDLKANPQEKENLSNILRMV